VELKVISQNNHMSGIDINRLKAGTQIFAVTANNTYIFTVLPGGYGRVKVKGGSYFREETETTFVGSTWGGSVLKLGWINYGMSMEIMIDPPKFITTSPVQAAIVSGPNWQYEMEWSNQIDPGQI
jgi:hypothetical protein